MTRFIPAVLCMLAMLPAVAHAQADKKPAKTKKAIGSGPIPQPEFKKCAELTEASVVRVRTERGLGTGFAVGDGTVLVTNSHVINQAKEISIKATDGTEQTATVLLDVPHRDLAALRITTAVKPLLLAEDNQYWETTPILVIGHGLGINNLQNDGGITARYTVRQLLDERIRPDWPTRNDTVMLVMDATIRPGHSGSPVVTPDGLVVGVAEGLLEKFPKVNFAVEVKHVRELLNDAVPDMDLGKGKLSEVERIRLERGKRLWSIQKIHEDGQRKREQQVTSSDIDYRANFARQIMSQMGRAVR